MLPVVLKAHDLVGAAVDKLKRLLRKTGVHPSALETYWCIHPGDETSGAGLYLYLTDGIGGCRGLCGARRENPARP